MKFTWLGQAGILLEKNGKKIMIDPYLSDSIHKKDPTRTRRYPADLRYLGVTPNVLIFTHDHIDHYDPDTAPILLKNAEGAMTVLCPSSVWQKARTEGGPHNYVQFNRYTEWTEHGFRFRAVKAEHSDVFAIGVLIKDLADGRIYYVTGDTLYNKAILADLPEDLDAVFLPINGVGNNMNAEDASRFADATGAKNAVPLHFGMFDEKTADGVLRLSFSPQTTEEEIEQAIVILNDAGRELKRRMQ